MLKITKVPHIPLYEVIKQLPSQCCYLDVFSWYLQSPWKRTLGQFTIQKQQAFLLVTFLNFICPWQTWMRLVPCAARFHASMFYFSKIIMHTAHFSFLSEHYSPFPVGRKYTRHLGGRTALLIVCVCVTYMAKLKL